MNKVRQDDIDNLLASWAEAKEHIASLEQSIEKYKRLATKILHKNDTEKVTSDAFTLTRRTMSRRIISKNDVPKEIWARYSKPVECTAFYLTKNK